VTIRILYVSNLIDATYHYGEYMWIRSDIFGIAGLVIPTEALYNEMKRHKTYKDMIEELKGEILSRITDEAIEDGETISDLKPYKEILKCSTLGLYLVNLEYSFVLKRGENKMEIHYWGKDECDFENHKNDSDFKNLIPEYIPHKIAQAV